MDLKEGALAPVMRHPWELARLAMIRSLFLKVTAGRSAVRVLDIGCGDGFMLGCLGREERIVEAHGLDIHLPAEALGRMSCGKTAFFNDPAPLRHEYDVVLLCDVLEHVDDDRAFLRKVAEERSAPGTVFILTVPACQAIFSAHDVFLGHRRRYSARGLGQAIEGAGLEVVERGSMFFTLLVARSLICLKEKCFGARPQNCAGAGQWRGGRVVSRLMTWVLCLDNLKLYLLSRLGIRVPGLTTWAVARRVA